MKPSRVLLLVGAGLAALYAACVLPSEPSGAERIQFSLNFPLPYRVPLGVSVEPSIQVLANGREVPYADYRLETLSPNIVEVAAQGQDTSASEGGQRQVLRGFARGAGTVRVEYVTGTGTPDTVFPVQVVISTIRVQGALDSMTSTMTLTQLKQQRALRADAYDANNQPVSNVTFAWSSSDSTIATVDAQGRVTAEDEGTATITATADSVSRTVTVRVVQAAARVQVLPELDTLRTVSRTREFDALAFDSSNSAMFPVKVTWRSANPLVASIDNSGLAVAVGAGTALIIATVGPAADTAALIVKQVVRFVDIEPKLDTLTAIDDTKRFVALAKDSGGTDVLDPPAMTWATADPAIATVDQAGLVRARKNGLVLVTASVGGQAGSALALVRQEVVTAQIVEDSVVLAGENATVRLTALGWDRNGYPAPEGRFAWTSRLAFVATVNDTGLVTARGDGTTRISAAPENGGPSDTATVTVTGAPQQLIAFDSPQGIELIRADGSLRATVLPGYSNYYATEAPQDPAWSPDGNRMTYLHQYIDHYYGGYYNSWAISIAPADGSSRVDPIYDWSPTGEPVWSPDGARIAFSRSDGFGSPNIFVMNADGSDVRGLTDTTGGQDSKPAWSPDGTKIAFQSNRNGNWEIYVMNADGSGVARLTNDPRDDLEPAWSPDGSELALTRNHDIWLMNADGSGARNLTASAAESEHDPAWSPDGTHLVFDSCTLPACPVRDLYVVRSDGTGLRRLTTGANAFRPSWRSPTPLTPPATVAPTAAPQARRRSAP